MRLVWATDIHADMSKEGPFKWFCADIVKANPDLIVITGDISNGQPARYIRAVYDHVKKPIHFVIGNHDFYMSSVTEIRQEVDNLCHQSGYAGDVFYLPHRPPLALTDKVCLIGVDGFGDGGYGNWNSSNVWLNDYNLTKDFSAISFNKTLLLNRLKELAKYDAERIFLKLEAAFKTFDKVIVATHVPPWREAMWHEGSLSDDNWAPHFGCKAVGDAVVKAIKYYDEEKQKKILVLCGHVHSQGGARINPQIVAWTGAARYGKPAINAIIDIEDDRISTDHSLFQRFIV